VSEVRVATFWIRVLWIHVATFSRVDLQFMLLFNARGRLFRPGQSTVVFVSCFWYSGSPFFNSDDGCDGESDYEQASAANCLSLANAAFDDAMGRCLCMTIGRYENIGSIMNDIDATTTQQQTLTTLAIVGAAISSFLGSTPGDKYGRKKSYFLE